jgi:hypothetical protein
MTRNALYWILLAGLIPGLWRLWRHPAARPALIWMALYYGGMAFSKSFLFGWYYVPPAPVYALTAMTGWAWMIGRMPARAKWFTPRLAAAAILIAGLAMLPRQKTMIAADQAADVALLESTGRMLGRVIPPGETLMLEPIGWIGYTSGAKILDAVGLVSPEVIPFFKPGAVSPYLDMLAALKPEWVLLRTGEYDDAVNARVPGDRALFAHYSLIREIPTPDSPQGRPAFYLLRRR